MAEIGERLRLTREALGLTQDEAAEISGSTRSAWSNYEAEERPLDSMVAMRFAKERDVALDYIFLNKIGLLRHDLVVNIKALQAKQVTPASLRKKARLGGGG